VRIKYLRSFLEGIRSAAVDEDGSFNIDGSDGVRGKPFAFEKNVSIDETPAGRLYLVLVSGSHIH
jgi:hypothetical protein